MKAKLTKRSKTDGTLVTIALHQFEEVEDNLLQGYWNFIGTEVTVVIDGVPTVCILARPNAEGVPTAMTTRALPRHIRLPRVGRPIYAEISEIY